MSRSRTVANVGGTLLLGAFHRRQLPILARAGASQSAQTRALSTPTPSNVTRIQNTPHLKRKLGQHLLVSEEILTKIVDAAELPLLLEKKKQRQCSGSDSEQDTCTLNVLEIGPGTGNLTSALLNVSPQVHVHAIEYDTRMVERLQERFVKEMHRLTIEHEDFENFQFTAMANSTTKKQTKHMIRKDDPRFDACVANIPYQLSSIIISRLTNYMHHFPQQFACAVLLVQEEFALRLLAKPGEQNYSRLSVNTSLIADVTSVVKVTRGHFLPPPKVDSRVIKLTPKLHPSVPTFADQSLFFQKFDMMLRICFLRKNKTLRALLLSKTAREQMVLSDEFTTEGVDTKNLVMKRVEQALEECEMNSSRAVQIPVNQFLRLMHVLESSGISFRPSITRHFQD